MSLCFVSITSISSKHQKQFKVILDPQTGDWLTWGVRFQYIIIFSIGKCKVWGWPRGLSSRALSVKYKHEKKLDLAGRLVATAVSWSGLSYVDYRGEEERRRSNNIHSCGDQGPHYRRFSSGPNWLNLFTYHNKSWWWSEQSSSFTDKS